MQPDSAPEIDDAARVMRVLADRTRFSILLLLEEKELPVGEIADRLNRPVPAVSQHLAKLRAEGCVQVRRVGTSAFYSQPDLHLAQLVRHALHYAEHRLYAEPPHHATDGGAHHHR